MISYGFCEKTSFFTKKVFNIRMIVPIILLIFIIVICIYFLGKQRKRNGNKFITAKYLNSKALYGQYIIINPQNNNFVFNQSNAINNHSILSTNELLSNGKINKKFKASETNNHSLITTETPKKLCSLLEVASNSGSFFPSTISLRSSETNKNVYIKNNVHKRKTLIQGANRCLVCSSKRIHSFANCGCGLCQRDYRIIMKKKKKYICPLHKAFVQEGFIFMKDKQQFQLLINETKKTDNKTIQNIMCPICQISPGTCTFNCNCPVLLCAKCFNDNLNMFNIRQCPGCKKKYKKDE